MQPGEGGKADGVTLRIRRAETSRLARELAGLTGETVTEAVTAAVRERLGRVRVNHGSRLADRLLSIGEDCAAHLAKPYRTIGHAELLYDERGLPR